MTQGRILGLDIGGKRIGTAISDEGGMLASPTTMIERGRNDRAGFRALLERWQPVLIVAGLPVSMSGREGPQAIETRAYAEELAKSLQLPLSYWDERLSSVAAERVLLEGGVKREQRKQKIDSMAATIMLQGYLDHERMRANRRR